jgi:hypothetical protein
MDASQVQGNQSIPDYFRQVILNSIVSKNKLDAVTGKDPSVRGNEMQLVFQEFAQMDPTTLGRMTAAGAFGNFGRMMGSRFGFGGRGRGRSRKKRKTRRR